MLFHIYLGLKFLLFWVFKMEDKFSAFVKNLGIENIDKDLLLKALSHSSYTKEQNINKLNSYERLEFLGDSVLKLVSSKYLYEKYPDFLEGDLTKIRSILVSDATLSKFAIDLKFQDVILLSGAERKDGGANKKMILACAFESLLGAIFLTYGYEFCEKFLSEIIKNEVEVLAKNLDNLNPKGKLQELLQSKGKELPKYVIVEEIGAAHNRTFVCEVIIDGIPYARASASSKKEAEAKVAQIAYEKMEKNFE